MKQKRITRKSVYFLLFLSSILILFLVRCRNRPIRLPNVDEIVRIEMASSSMLDFNMKEIEITNVDDIKIIMTAFSSARLISRWESNDNFAILKEHSI